MSKLIDLTGWQSGKLTAIKPVGKDERGNILWECHCTCGKTCTVAAYLLKSYHTQSCGCSRSGGTHKTHGKTHDPIYKVWYSMLGRCNNPNNKAYPNYGGRGIRVCERWLIFENFYEDVSKLEHFGEKGYSLDRIDNDGNYEPSNVRFADRKTQQRNTSRNIMVEYKGQEMTLAEAAELSGINYSTLCARYNRDGKRGDELFKTTK